MNKEKKNINFIGKKNIAFIFSTILILSSIISLITKGGPNYGIDFTGGTLLQIKFEDKVTPLKIKETFFKMGFDEVAIQLFGNKHDNEFLIRIDKTENDFFSKELEGLISKKIGINAEIRRVEMVGPQVGKNLREKALFAMFYALLFITIYISGRFELKWALSVVIAAFLMTVVYLLSLFNTGIPIIIFCAIFVSLILFYFFKLQYATGAILALIHDILITVGIFSILDKEFSLPIIAALLTIIGYSLNDTIIVFDRIRENIKSTKNEKNLALIINDSINNTLSRTILTSFTTLIVILTLLLFGGGIIHDFAFAMFIGVVVGTYSSIFVASPILLLWKKRDF